jgi:hypothetical protein
LQSFIERRTKNRHYKEKAPGSGQVGQKCQSLFKGQFINFKGKQKKSEQSLQQGLARLTGLTDKIF